MTLLNNDPTPAEDGAVPFIETNSKLITNDGLYLHLHAWIGSEAPDKIVMIVHGMGGHGAYYAKALAPYLVPEGAALYAVDLRGHGLSDGVHGDIDDFDYYQQDIATAVRYVRGLYPDLPMFMLGESMGTSLAINYTVNASAEVRPHALALIACVVAPTVQPHVDEVIRTVYYFVRDRRKVVIPITGREEQGIRDLDFIQVLKADKLFNRKVSVRFLLKLTAQMRKALHSPERLTLPIFVAQGGHDITVQLGRTKAFFAKIASQDKEVHIFPEAYHALLNDPVSPQVRELLLKWLERQRQNFYAQK